jgi:hypothetical protein
LPGCGSRLRPLALQGSAEVVEGQQTAAGIASVPRIPGLLDIKRARGQIDMENAAVISERLGLRKSQNRGHRNEGSR